MTNDEAMFVLSVSSLISFKDIVSKLGIVFISNPFD